MAYYGDYYRGDYYRGDYYRGDPIFGALLAGVAKVGFGLVKKGVTALVSGGAKKAIVNTAIGVGTGIAVEKASQYMQGGAPPPMVISPPIAGQVAAPPGMKVAKTPGIGGKISRALPFGQTGYEYVKRRRMNVTNVKALRRSIRRAKGFAKLAKRVLTFVQPRAPKGKAIFKSRKR
jgi:hypothetical protein